MLHPADQSLILGGYRAPRIGRRSQGRAGESGPTTGTGNGHPHSQTGGRRRSTQTGPAPEDRAARNSIEPDRERSFERKRR